MNAGAAGVGAVGSSSNLDDSAFLAAGEIHGHALTDGKWTIRYR
jgi:hypothetical protein